MDGGDRSSGIMVHHTVYEYKEEPDADLDQGNIGSSFYSDPDGLFLLLRHSALRQ